MKIRFLKQVEAPQEVFKIFCECCGPEPDGYQDTTFIVGEELDPEETYNKVDLSSLTFNEDYIIIEYP